MAKEELTREQAKELFYSKKGQGAWEVMTHLVGPPVEHAFREDYMMRFCLIAVFGAMMVRLDKSIAEKTLEDLKVVDACTVIGAVEMAEICRKALAILGGKVPVDRVERMNVMPDDEETEEILDACDTAFFACEENLLALGYAYIMQNKGAFC